MIALDVSSTIGHVPSRSRNPEGGAGFHGTAGQFSRRARGADRRRDEFASFISSPPINQYARNAPRFPIVLERFMSSGASPGVRLSSHVPGTRYPALARARPIRENAVEHNRGWNAGESRCGPGVFINWIKGGEGRDAPLARAVCSARSPPRRTLVPIDRVFSARAHHAEPLSRIVRPDESPRERE